MISHGRRWIHDHHRKSACAQIPAPPAPPETWSACNRPSFLRLRQARFVADAALRHADTSHGAGIDYALHAGLARPAAGCGCRPRSTGTFPRIVGPQTVIGGDMEYPAHPATARSSDSGSGDRPNGRSRGAMSYSTWRRITACGPAIRASCTVRTWTVRAICSRPPARPDVERLVYTSTVGCIGVPSGGVGDETMPVGIGDMKGAYKRSKFLAEQDCRGICGIRFAGCDRKSNGARWGSRFQADADREDRAWTSCEVRCRRIVDTGLNLVDADDIAGRPFACLRTRPRRGALYPWVRKSDASGDLRARRISSAGSRRRKFKFPMRWHTRREWRVRPGRM